MTTGAFAGHGLTELRISRWASWAPMREAVAGLHLDRITIDNIRLQLNAIERADGARKTEPFCLFVAGEVSDVKAIVRRNVDATRPTVVVVAAAVVVV